MNEVISKCKGNIYKEGCFNLKLIKTKNNYLLICNCQNIEK